MRTYVSVDEARKASGLRLVLSPGRPGGWTESAKNICHVKGLDFLAAEQEVNSDNLRLRDWTNQTSAPVVAWEDETPRTSWIEQLFLFERLAPYPPLIPEASAARALMLGLSAELLSEWGFGWCRRLMILHDTFNDTEASDYALEFANRMAPKYGYTPEKAKEAPKRVAAILRTLDTQLARQNARGKAFFIGNQLTALDIYWASFCALVEPLPHDLCPMNDWFRENYTLRDPVARAAITDRLLEHRDRIYQDFLELPVDLGTPAPKDEPIVELEGPQVDEDEEFEVFVDMLPSEEEMSPKVCVIVGAGPGNGASVARRFAREGYRVALLARDKAKVDALAADIPDARGYACDATDADAVRDTFKQVHEDLGAVDVLVYNAGSGLWGTFDQVDVDTFELAWRVNVFGLLLAARECTPMLKATQGALAVMGAGASWRGRPMTAAFAQAKAAQRSLAQSLGRQLGAEGVHVSYCILDGVVDLPATRAWMKDKPDDYFAKPDDIADAIYYVCHQPKSAWTFEYDLRPFGENW